MSGAAYGWWACFTSGCVVTTVVCGCVQVTYLVEGFLDKNKDLLYHGLSAAMFACERKLLKELFEEGNPENISRKRPPTAGSQFKTSVTHLIRSMMEKNPNYIRCIKVSSFSPQHLGRGLCTVCTVCVVCPMCMCAVCSVCTVCTVCVLCVLCVLCVYCVCTVCVLCVLRVCCVCCVCCVCAVCTVCTVCAVCIVCAVVWHL